MRHSERDLDAGLIVHTRLWEPDGVAEAVVRVVHGLGEHSGRYGLLAGRLTEAGYAVSPFDPTCSTKSTTNRNRTGSSTT